jgi:hypothetical protein
MNFSEGFGWVRTGTLTKFTDTIINPPKTYPVEVRYANSLHSQVGRYRPDDWYDNGPYTIVAYRPLAAYRPINPVGI